MNRSRLAHARNSSDNARSFARRRWVAHRATADSKPLNVIAKVCRRQECQCTRDVAGVWRWRQHSVDESGFSWGSHPNTEICPSNVTGDRSSNQLRLHCVAFHRKRYSIECGD